MTNNCSSSLDGELYINDTLVFYLAFGQDVYSTKENILHIRPLTSICLVFSN